MADDPRREPLSRKERFERSFTPRQRRYGIDECSLRPIAGHPNKSSLADFRAHETHRAAKLRRLYEESLPAQGALPGRAHQMHKSPDMATLHHHPPTALRKGYADEYWRSCGGTEHSRPSFDSFILHVEQAEQQLWDTFHSVDANNDHKLSVDELQHALHLAGIHLSDSQVNEFILQLDTNLDGLIEFDEWRNFFLPLSRDMSLPEIYHFYLAYRSPRIPASRLTPDGDVTLAPTSSQLKGKQRATEPPPDEAPPHFDDDEEEHEHGLFEGAGKYLLAGGIAGAVSRTATAPFDRLKVFLINNTSASATSNLNLKPFDTGTQKPNGNGFGALHQGMKYLYREAGFRAFFVGNGLNIIKIFPESACKFWTYESMKRLFARYVDNVKDVSQISNTSRFISGGVGGVSSQLAIYGLETWKTRVMSSTGGELKGNALYIATCRKMYAENGVRAFYRGLPWGLLGVFPYSAVDMSLFHVFKTAYRKYSGCDEPGVLASLTFGAMSGGIGATSVYPLNLIRTRLQTQGTPAHPQTYTGIKDVTTRTWRKEGLRGFYKGLAPTLLKVMPAISLSWTVYEGIMRIVDAPTDV